MWGVGGLWWKSASQKLEAGVKRWGFGVMKSEFGVKKLVFGEATSEFDAMTLDFDVTKSQGKLGFDGGMLDFGEQSGFVDEGK